MNSQIVWNVLPTHDRLFYVDTCIEFFELLTTKRCTKILNADDSLNIVVWMLFQNQNLFLSHHFPT